MYVFPIPKVRGFEIFCIYAVFAYIRFAYIRSRLYVAAQLEATALPTWGNSFGAFRLSLTFSQVYKVGPKLQ